MPPDELPEIMRLAKLAAIRTGKLRPTLRLQPDIQDMWLFVRVDPLFEAARKALEKVKKHQKRILERWTSTHSNARMEAMNGLFQAARARARGYRNTETFITMIYLIAAPLGDIIKST